MNPIDRLLETDWARALAAEWGEATLRQLLASESEETSDSLFSLQRDSAPVAQLSDEERRLGMRHMQGGMPGADDLSSFIEEEIVLSSVGESSDIYAPREAAHPASAAERQSVIAVDHSRNSSDSLSLRARPEFHGADVLGLGPPATLQGPGSDATSEVVPAAGEPEPRVLSGESAPEPKPAPAAAPEAIAERAPEVEPGVADAEQVSELPAAAPPPEASPARAIPVAASTGGAASEQWSWCVPEGITFNFTTRSGTELFPDFLDAFIEEAGGELEKLEDAIGLWEREPAGEAAQTVGRILHTLKGIAKGVGLQRYGTLVHNFETLLLVLPGPDQADPGEYFRRIYAWLDHLVQGYEHIQAQREDVASELPLADAEQAAPAAAEATGNAQGDVDAQRQADRQLADAGARALAAQQTIRVSAETLDQLLNLSTEVQKLGVRAAQSTLQSRRAGGELLSRLTALRTQVSRIADRSLLSVTARGLRDGDSGMDALEMDQYTEIHEAANILREAVEDLDDLMQLANRHTAAAESLLKQQAGTLSSLGAGIRAARVVPVSRLLPGLRRIVRTVSAELGKSVMFRPLAQSGSLDRDSYACCQIVLEHMVRNALDHGVETPEERQAVGKPDTAMITVDFRKQGSDYLVTLSDDGRGIDPDRVREQARRKGLVEDPDSLTDDEARQLIFQRGFSTAAAVSEISGRGVGMDIVVQELQRIGGDISIDSRLGQGTSFRIRLPSNITVNGALLVRAGEAAYAVPFEGLIGIEYPSVEAFHAARQERQPLALLGRACEPAYLGTLCSGLPVPPADSWELTVPVIVAGLDGRYMAIAVDSLEQAEELVIRSLGNQFAAVPWLAGASTTADGQAVVALNLNTLVEYQPEEASLPEPTAEAGDTTAPLLALVVDDSRTQRLVATSQLHTLGVQTVTAEHGLAALEWLRETSRLPDVVLMDIEMPVKDGIQTLRELRADPRLAALPVITITSRTGPKHRSLASEAGCNAFLGKPFNFPELLAEINRLTGRSLRVDGD